jgi:hypothetical protein
MLNYFSKTLFQLDKQRGLVPKFTSLSMDSLNLITFGMSAVSLVGAVIQLAMISSENADAIYRSYLGKVACCHFTLVSTSEVFESTWKV